MIQSHINFQIDAIIAAECDSGREDVVARKRGANETVENVLTRAQHLHTTCLAVLTSQPASEIGDATKAFKVNECASTEILSVGREVLYRSKGHPFPLAARIVAIDNAEDMFFTVHIFSTDQEVNTVKSRLIY